MYLPLLSDPSRRITEKIRNRLVQRSSAKLKIVEGSEPHATTVPLFQIPLELVYKILWYLGPNDLLNLSQTNKSFRAFLLGESCNVY
ncbi:hypothetical protein HETIRDRAFT_169920 [Heterobasidion irregulare TC 32-1]|uniref:F-box domain-containing protein n=1 Tax=Heterobasidion irregulare (strain TC 32-1) TaxID=747525 RepID=W4K5S2_HETIT|nr:uncharacterized protein HETIRDRAFT_169920 [Heterobasidion irregulare TC 32-1]ETW81168.1 hypothetical protein HETIRDRAFT_169920 [Heterobasidion irregulare TC 32-1]